jgi:hypothetical protein
MEQTINPNDPFQVLLGATPPKAPDMLSVVAMVDSVVQSNRTICKPELSGLTNSRNTIKQSNIKANGSQEFAMAKRDTMGNAKKSGVRVTMTITKKGSLLGESILTDIDRDIPTSADVYRQAKNSILEKKNNRIGRPGLGRQGYSENFFNAVEKYCERSPPSAKDDLALGGSGGKSNANNRSFGIGNVFLKDNYQPNNARSFKGSQKNSFGQSKSKGNLSALLNEDLTNGRDAMSQSVLGVSTGEYWLKNNHNKFSHLAEPEPRNSFGHKMRSILYPSSEKYKINSQILPRNGLGPMQANNKNEDHYSLDYTYRYINNTYSNLRPADVSQISTPNQPSDRNSQDADPKDPNKPDQKPTKVGILKSRKKLSQVIKKRRGANFIDADTEAVGSSEGEEFAAPAQAKKIQQ